MNIHNFHNLPHTPTRHTPNGKGEMLFARVWKDEDFATQWSFVDHVILPPGASIGAHTHGKNEEMYIILSGSGVMTVDGETRTVHRGDMILNRVNGTHGLENTSNADVELLVVEVAAGKKG